MTNNKPELHLLGTSSNVCSILAKAQRTMRNHLKSPEKSYEEIEDEVEIMSKDLTSKDNMYFMTTLFKYFDVY